MLVFETYCDSYFYDSHFESCFYISFYEFCKFYFVVILYVFHKWGQKKQTLVSRNAGDILFSSLVSFAFLMFLVFFGLLVCFLKLKIYILINIQLCGRVSDKIFFYQANFQKQDYFFGLEVLCNVSIFLGIFCVVVIYVDIFCSWCDTHLILSAVKPRHGKITAIPNNMEHYTSFIINNVTFIGSCQYIFSSLDNYPATWEETNSARSENIYSHFTLNN